MGVCESRYGSGTASRMLRETSSESCLWMEGANPSMDGRMSWH